MQTAVRHDRPEDTETEDKYQQFVWDPMESLPFGAPSHLHGGMSEPNEVSDDRTTTELISSTHKGEGS
jgi:hypothetical protein